MEFSRNTLNTVYSDNEKERLLSLPFAEAIRFWLYCNDTPAATDSTKRDREYKLHVTERILKELPKEIGELKLNEITRNELQTMYKVLKGSKNFKVRATTRKKWQKFICTMYTNLVNSYVICANPTYAWKTESCEPEKTPRIDMPTLVNYFDLEPKTYLDFRNLAIFAIPADTGIRIGSLQKLQVNDLVIQKIEGKEVVLKIRIRGAKYGTNYEVSVGAKTSEIILNYLNIRPNVDIDDLFLKENGEILSYWGYRQVFSRRSKKVGTQVTPHMFRATLASEKAKHTRNYVNMKGYLGVKSDSVAYRYIREAEDDDVLTENRKNSIVNEIFSIGENSNNDSHLDEFIQQNETFSNVENVQYGDIGIQKKMDLPNLSVYQTPIRTVEEQRPLESGISNLVEETYKVALKEILLQKGKSPEEITLEARKMLEVYRNLVSVSAS